MAKLDYKNEIKVWSVFFLTIILTIYAHEIGHCIPAWIKGIRAIPTPAKEYMLDIVPLSLKPNISLWGIACTLFFSIIVITLYLMKPFKNSSAVLAGAIAMPGIYSLRFFVAGRGHDATEFQEAQSALGLDYEGHFLDWAFFALFLLGVAIWIIKSNPGFKITGRLFIGFILTVIFIIGLQVINNAIFDPIFQ